MMEALSLSAAAWSAFGSDVDRKRIVVFAKRHFLVAELDLHEMVAIQVIGGLIRQVRSDAHREWAEHRIPDVKIVVQVSAWNPLDDAVVWIVGGIRGHPGFKRAAHLHAGDDSVHALLIPAFHARPVRADEVFLAYPFLGALDRDTVIAGVALDPAPIFRSAFSQNLGGDWILSQHVAEEIDDVCVAAQQRQVALDDDAVETVVNKDQEAFQQLREDFHRSPPPQRFLTRQQDHLSGDRWNQPGSERSMVLGVLATWRETKEGWYDRERHCRGNRRRRLWHAYDARPGLAGIRIRYRLGV